MKKSVSLTIACVAILFSCGLLIKLYQNPRFQHTKELIEVPAVDELSSINQYIDEKRGIKFKYPYGWSVEELMDQNVLLVLAPVIEKGWQTNIFFEIYCDLDKRDIDNQLEDYISSLNLIRGNFALQERRIIKTKTGLDAGCFMYTNELDEIKLKNMEYLIQVGDNIVLFVAASAEESLWAKYLDSINLVLDSIEIIESDIKNI